MPIPDDDAFWNAVKTDRERLEVTYSLEDDPKIERLAREVFELRREMELLKDRLAARPATGKSRLERPVSTGLGIGVGIILAPVALLVLGLICLLFMAVSG